MTELQLQLNETLYVKDPQQTDLGKNIIRKSIEMIDEMGFEAFTFKKLSSEISSTEASVYRYFENKHRLLLYLIAWYWSYSEYLIAFETHHIATPQLKLARALEIVSMEKSHDMKFPNINEPALERVVIAESDKTFLTKQVDDINKMGVFNGYKSLCQLIADMILDINPDYPFAHSLASTVLEASNQQLYFAGHLSSLTSIDRYSNERQQNYDFIKDLVFKAIGV